MPSAVASGCNLVTRTLQTSSRLFDHLDWADDVLIEFRKFFGGKPEFPVHLIEIALAEVACYAPR